jgi:aryl-alcohol dehydrogenase-like predicted oxidoreductase
LGKAKVIKQNMGGIMEEKNQVTILNNISSREISRRDFVVRTALIGAGLALGNLSCAAITKGSSQDSRKGKIMEKRELGKSGLIVSQLGLGCQNFTFAYGPPRDKDHSIRVMRTAYENGARLFDTAEAYGASEEYVGEALQPFRDKVAISTKFMFGREQNLSVADRLKNIRKSLETSLKDLKTDHVELYYQHRMHPEVPIEEVIATFKEFIREGKILHYGLSEVGPKIIRRAHAVHPVTAIQNEYSFIERTQEKNGVIQTCEELGIGFVPWSPLSYGYLTGTVDPNMKFPEGDWRNFVVRMNPENRAANMPIVDLLRRFAKMKNATSGQIALAWLIARKNFIVPIPGTTNIEHAKENLGTINVNLTAADMRELETEFSKLIVHGARTIETFMGDGALRK